MLFLKNRLKDKIRKYKRRKIRTNTKLKSQLPEVRVVINRSNKYIKAQAIDLNGKVLGLIIDKTMKGKTKTERAKQAGEDLAKQLTKSKITKVTFDRNGYLYHGRVSAFADGMREGGISL